MFLNIVSRFWQSWSGGLIFNVLEFFYEALIIHFFGFLGLSYIYIYNLGITYQSS